MASVQQHGGAVYFLPHKEKAYGTNCDSTSTPTDEQRKDKVHVHCNGRPVVFNLHVNFS